MKISATVIATAVVCFFLSNFLNKQNFPITFKVCGIGYVDCVTVAKYKDRADCETTKKHWGWYCDASDKNNIICAEKDSPIAISYCE